MAVGVTSIPAHGATPLAPERGARTWRILKRLVLLKGASTWSMARWKRLDRDKAESVVNKLRIKLKCYPWMDGIFDNRDHANKVFVETSLFYSYTHHTQVPFVMSQALSEEALEARLNTGLWHPDRGVGGMHVI
jgi:hypothetical protein